MKLQNAIRTNIVKIAIIMIFTLIINVFIGKVETYAWFNDSSSIEIKANVAKTRDIIKSAIIQYPEPPDTPGKVETPAKLIITKEKSCKFNPTIYFELSGRLSYYIQHLNPIELNDEKAQYLDLEGNNVYEIPLYMKVNLIENMRLSDADIISSEIFLRYLDDFIRIPIKDDKNKLIEYNASNLKNADCHDKNYSYITKIDSKTDISSIKEVSINSEDKPNKIIITRFKEDKTEPLIYFELTGTIPYFVQHINPVRLNNDNKSYLDSQGNYVYEIPICLKLNNNEIAVAKYTQLTSIEGQIVLRWLNYRGNAVNIKLTKSYLNSWNSKSFDPYLK